MAEKTSILILMHTGPYSGQQARAAIDLALTAAAFELRVSCVLLDEAVLQLMDEQDTGATGQKNVYALLSALEIYEVENLYVHAPSAARYQVAASDMPAFCKALDDEQLKQLVVAADQVMVF